MLATADTAAAVATTAGAVVVAPCVLRAAVTAVPTFAGSAIVERVAFARLRAQVDGCARVPVPVTVRVCRPGLKS